MPDPFKRFPNSVLWPALLISLLFSLLLLTAMTLLDRNLKTAPAPRGIVSIELAGNLDDAQQILESWKTQGKISAALSLGLDYLFLIVYALFISVACVLIARNLIPGYVMWAKFGFLLGWGQFAAAFLDAVENFALIRFILDSQSEILPAVARWCAIVKFGIVGAGLVYILVGVIFTVLRKGFRLRNS